MEMTLVLADPLVAESLGFELDMTGRGHRRLAMYGVDAFVVERGMSDVLSMDALSGLGGSWRAVSKDSGVYIESYANESMLPGMCAESLWNEAVGTAPGQDVPDGAESVDGGDIPEHIKAINDGFEELASELTSEQAEKAARLMEAVSHAAWDEGMALIPKDADGIPCMPGDSLTYRSEADAYDRTEFNVIAVSHDSVYYDLDGGSIPTTAALSDACVHCSPRTLEDILLLFGTAWFDSPGDDSLIEEAANAIRKLG